MTTAAPAAASRRTVALPRPPVPPVTIALFPSSRTRASTSEMTFLSCEDNVSGSCPASEVPADNRAGDVLGGRVGEHIVQRGAEQAQVSDHARSDPARWSARCRELAEEEAERAACGDPLAGADDGARGGTPSDGSCDHGPWVGPAVGRIRAGGDGYSGGD